MPKMVGYDFAIDDSDWLIRNKIDDTFWRVGYGWTTYTYGTLFSAEEKNKFNCPDNGRWEVL